MKITVKYSTKEVLAMEKTTRRVAESAFSCLGKVLSVVAEMQNGDAARRINDLEAQLREERLKKQNYPPTNLSNEGREGSVKEGV